ncbi:MAG: beta-ribofuranosylaminobenzene 5'-phosphate synthase family protein [Acidobacteriota bacterium]
MSASERGTVFVEAAARLHFGLIDLRGELGRWFGGIGAAAPAPSLLVSAEAAGTLEVEGADADRVAGFACRFLSGCGLEGGARLRVHRRLPSHVGLGSGTQLALAVARALAELHGVAADAPALARMVGRAQRSAIGTWAFAGGGLILEGGRRRGHDGVPPLLARLSFPPTWRCIVAVPAATPGISGHEEDAAFAAMPAPPERDAERVAHLVVMALLPAVADGDLATFGAALSAIQAINGRWFAPVQGGTFAPGASEELVRRMADWGASGVGQSSWGPAVYGIVDGEQAGMTLAERVRGAVGAEGAVYEGPFRTEGARVWREL